MKESKSNFLLIALFVFVTSLGLYGLSLTTEWSNSFANNLYAITGLFAFSGEWTQTLYDDGQMNGYIEFARFAAPTTTVLIFLVVMLDGAKQSIQYMLRARKGHTIVWGLGEKGLSIILTAIEKGESVIAINNVVDNPLVSQVRGKGCVVVNAMPISDKLFERLHMHDAANIFICGENDSQNIDYAETLVKFLNKDKGAKFESEGRIFVNLNETSTALRLSELPRFVHDFATDISFWNEHTMLAEKIVHELPPHYFSNLQQFTRPHVLILGESKQAIELGYTLIKNCVYQTLEPIKITYIPQGESSFLRQQPSVIKMQQVADVSVHDKNVDEFLLASEQCKALIAKASQVYVMAENGLNPYALCLELRSIMLKSCLFMSPLIYLTEGRHSDEQKHRVGSVDREIPDNIYAFGEARFEVSFEAIVRRDDTFLAQRIHEQAYAQPGQPKWHELSFSMRESNRAFVKSWQQKLASIGYVFGGKQKVEIDSQQLQLMAAMEHTRWCIERQFDDWKHSDKRSNLAKQHPLIKSWQALSQSQQDGNAQFFSGALNELNSLVDDKKIRELDNGIGFQRVRTIGVTGHRFMSLDDKAKVCLVKAIDKELLNIREAYPNHHFRIVSPLAEGADRLVADRALTILNAELIAILPMSYELYKSDFSQNANVSENESEKEFEQLIAKAKWYAEIPPTYSDLADIESNNDVRAQQYAAVAAHLIEMCDDLIAIWDGEDAKGIGGTSDVVKWWNTGEVPASLKVVHPVSSKRDPQPARVIPFSRA